MWPRHPNREQQTMNLHEIYLIAKTHGLQNPDLFFSESGVIRAIQKSQGHDPCFRIDRNPYCPEQTCQWREHCLKLTAEWQC
jgi:hypothetical protein